MYIYIYVQSKMTLGVCQFSSQGTDYSHFKGYLFPKNSHNATQKSGSIYVPIPKFIICPMKEIEFNSRLRIY